MTETILKRMLLSSWNKIRICFYARKGESAAHYFERLSKHLEEKRFFSDKWIKENTK
jgi:hypothetical protein